MLDRFHDNKTSFYSQRMPDVNFVSQSEQTVGEGEFSSIGKLFHLMT